MAYIYILLHDHDTILLYSAHLIKYHRLQNYKGSTFRLTKLVVISSDS